jgi:prepilin-type processing-associated H-X9-DG protein
VTFTVEASGTGLRYQWQRSSNEGATWADIAGATTNQLNISSVSAADEGLYRAVVSSDSAQVASNQARLTVAGEVALPSITQQPQSATVTAGQATTFTVAADSGTALSYQWLLNGAEIPGATSASYTTSASSMGDNGASYSVRVTNSAGSITTSPVILTVVAVTNNAAYWIAGLTHTSNLPSSDIATLYVVDPAAPSAHLLVHRMKSSTQVSFGLDSKLPSADEIQWLQINSSVTFVEDGRIKYVDLKAGSPARIQQWAAVDNACDGSFGPMVRVYFGGYSYEELRVRLDGGNGCDIAGTLDSKIGNFTTELIDSTQLPALVPYSTAAYSTTLIDFSEKTAVKVMMEPDGAGKFQLAAFNMDGTRLGLVTNGTVFSNQFWTPGFAKETGINSTVAFVDGHVRRMTWSGKHVTLGTSLYKADAAYVSFDKGLNHTYFGDGGKIRSIADGQSAVTDVMTLPVATGYAMTRLSTVDTVNAYFSTQAGCPTPGKWCSAIYTAPVNGGAATVKYIDGSRTKAPTLAPGLFYHNRLLLRVPLENGLWRVSLWDTKTNSESVLAENVSMANGVHAYAVDASYTRKWAALSDLDSIIYCEPLPDTTTCAGRKLIQKFLGSSNTLVLGDIPANLSKEPSFIPSMNSQGIGTINFSVKAHDSDLYLFKSGVANSLKFIATSTP